MVSRHDLRVILPAIFLVTLVALGLGAGYYFTAAQADQPVVTWTTSLLFITFTSRDGAGNARDSFTCSPSVSTVTLQASSDQPSIIMLTVSPTSFPGCGSSADPILVAASCTATARASNTCAGDFNGKVLVCGPSPYTCLKRTLVVIITVTNNAQNGQAQ